MHKFWHFSGSKPELTKVQCVTLCRYVDVHSGKSLPSSSTGSASERTTRSFRWIGASILYSDAYFKGAGVWTK